MCTYTLLYNDSRCALLCVRIKKLHLQAKERGVSAFAQANIMLLIKVPNSAYIICAFFVK